MGSVSVVEAARQSLGPVGVYLPTPFTATPPVRMQREAAIRLERAGYPVAWVNEPVGGKDPLVQIGLLLPVTERMTFGTGIANVWARAPQTAHAGAAMLADAYPGRLVLGLGVGYPNQAAAVGREFGRPVAMMRDYLERMAAPGMTPALEAPYPRIVAANGPKMLALASEAADGVLPAGLPPEFTAQVRKTVGPDKLLVAGLSTIIDTTDPGAARAQARQSVASALGTMTWQAATMARLGYSHQQIAEVSDDLVSAMIAHGSPDSIVSLVSAHLAAGADHVILMPTLGAAEIDLMTGVDLLERLAPAVLPSRLRTPPHVRRLALALALAQRAEPVTYGGWRVDGDGSPDLRSRNQAGGGVSGFLRRDEDAAGAGVLGGPPGGRYRTRDRSSAGSRSEHPTDTNEEPPGS